MQNNRQFRPSPVNTVLTIGALSAFILLGLWQLDRAEFKANAYQQFLRAERQPAVSLLSLFSQNSDSADFLWNKVSLSGEFDSGPVILLDNQVLNGAPGYNVIAGFRMDGSEKSVLINLGWIDADIERNDVGSIVVPAGHYEITGRIRVLEDNRFIDETVFQRLKNNIIRLQEINIDKVGALSGINYHPFILLLDPDVEFGYSRAWGLPDSEESRHQAYAFQWFCMALFILVVFVVLNIEKR